MLSNFRELWKIYLRTCFHSPHRSSSGTCISQCTEHCNNRRPFFITTGIFILSHVVSSDVGRKISQPRARVEHTHAWIGTWSVLTKTAVHGDTSCKALVLRRRWQWRRRRRKGYPAAHSCRCVFRHVFRPNGFYRPLCQSSAGYTSTRLFVCRAFLFPFKFSPLPLPILLI